MSAKKMVKTCLGSKIFNFFNNAFKNCCVAMNKLRRQQKGRKKWSEKGRKENICLRILFLLWNCLMNGAKGAKWEEGRMQVFDGK